MRVFNTHILYQFAFFFAFFFLSPHAGRAAALNEEIAAQIETLNFPFIESHGEQPAQTSGGAVLRKLYGQAKFAPLWLERPEKARLLARALQNCGKHGLNPNDYFLDELRPLSRQRDPKSLARLDVLLTAALLRYGFDLRYGHIALFRADMATFKEIHDFDFEPLTLLKTIYASDDFDQAFDNLAPKHQFYRGLQEKLAAAAHEPNQKKLARKIAVNMARWRWYPHLLGERFVVVNIAGQRLGTWRNDRQDLDMAVIVGKKENPTPLITGYLRWLEFHPSWAMPTEIAVKEQLPKLRKNPNHLAEKKVRLFSSWEPEAKELDPKRINWHKVTPEQMAKYQLRQEPGPMNALGRIKFMFPNPWSVYLHDTPGKALFKEAVRDLSHGCVRVADPASLAVFLLNNQDSDSSRAKIQARLDGRASRDMPLKHPVPVYLTYQTVWIDKNGGFRQATDMYGQDERILAKMGK
ncbi:MAG: L,D-transpeptidase family protein [Desulfobulbaceae bacterium]|nr:L,D-transpeptidase family protein [Desulfobulbaceae bacterium]